MKRLAVLLVPTLVCAFLQTPLLAQGDAGTARDVPMSRSPDVPSSTAYRFLEAKVLLGEGQYLEALEGLREVVDRAPLDPYARLELGRLASRIGRTEEAARQSDEAVRLAPRDPDVLYGAAEIYRALATREPGFTERARRTLAAMLELDAGDPRALVALGRISQESGDLAAAEEYYRRLTARQPGQRTATLLLQVLLEEGNREAAIGLIREVLEREPEALEMRLTLADLLAEAGREDEALQALQGAPPEIRNQVELVRREAGLWLSAGHPGRARERLEEAVGQNPDASRLHVFLALLLAEQGETERAIRTLEPFLEEDPRDADLANALVRILVEADRPGEARDVTSRVARELEPVDPDTAAELIRELMRTLARADRWDLVPELADEVPVRASSDVRAEILELVVEALRRRGRFEEALARIDASGLDGAALQATRAELLLRGDRPDRAAPILAELRTEDPQLAAQVYHALGRYEEALPLWERTVAADPVGPQARFALAAAYERTGRVGRAVDVFRDLITDFPDFHLALNYLGYMWAEQGANLEEAQSLVERAVSLDPGNGAYADSLGWVYYQRGEYEKALEHLRRAADVLPSDGTVQEHLGDVHLALGDPAAARDAYESALALGDVDREGELERKLKAVERLLRGQEP